MKKKVQKKIVFGSSMWVSCGPFKEKLEQSGIRFLYLDITSSLGFLKKYLEVRENAPQFEPIKEQKLLGLPVLVVGDNDKIIFDIDELDKFIKEELESQEA